MCVISLIVFIYLFIGRESKRTYMTDSVKKKCEINAKLREYTFYKNSCSEARLPRESSSLIVFTDKYQGHVRT